MLTYTLNDTDGPKYLQLSKLIKADVESGKLKAGDRLPSKRTFARNSGVSTITVQNAYDQLISEGYVTAVEKKGYYVSSFRKPVKTAPVIESTDLPEPDLPDLSGNRMREESFPFSIWSKLLRETLSTDRDKLLSPIRAEGVPELRKAIAGHLSSFRGMSVSPSQIVIGAGTEYLYSLLIQLLGRELVYAIEDPGYGKLSRIYAANAIKYTKVPLDEKGLSAELLCSSGADVAHISPNHHFPTGITMPLERRYELLAWAAAKETRFIIEDDYDSEFRVSKSPVPTMYSLDGSGSVIYMNTFSKSLASTIRISYMVLPETLGDTFRRELSFYASTVPSFEQYTLSRFISEGYFEKHINRMRL
ncbi:MAG: PLP-dependent aminotransferase family protein, partial [Bullifex sp.]|nr:PLP-dependent aminotransferase family protein [Spirochaetales bacterium]MDY5777247.1 PLP-dependent aminotransferase family protein [Bullifex sp.]